MKTISKLLHCRATAAWLVLSLLSTLPLLAQTVPALVNYQGRLANPDGTPLATGDYALTFSVYASATNPSTAATNLIWGPQVFDGASAAGHGGRIPVVQGHFNVILGPVDVHGVSLAEAFSTTNRYVEIRVGTNAPILPRQQILSAPFALQAGNSAKLASADWSVVFGTNDPVNGRIPTSKLATNGIILAQQVAIGTPATGNPLVVKSASPGAIPVVVQSSTGVGNILQIKETLTGHGEVTVRNADGFAIAALGSDAEYGKLVALTHNGSERVVYLPKAIPTSPAATSVSGQLPQHSHLRFAVTLQGRGRS